MKGKNAQFYRALKNITYISQVGLSLITPIIICIMGARWIQNTFEFGNWIVLLGIFVGLLSGISSFISTMQLIIKEVEKEEKKK